MEEGEIVAGSASSKGWIQFLEDQNGEVQLVMHGLLTHWVIPNFHKLVCMDVICVVKSFFVERN